MSLILKNFSIGHGYDLLSIDGLTLSPGTVIALSGPNGGGKSTLLRTIGQIIPARSGTIHWNNQNLQVMSVAAQASLISQHFSGLSPYGELTVEEIWQMSRPEGFSLDIVPDYWNCRSLASRQFSMLSDGQKQKVLLVRAMLSSSPILLLDEPTTHLDFHSVQELEGILRKMAVMQSRLIIFSSHDWQLIHRIADKVIHLAGTGDVDCAKPEDIFKRYYC